MLRTVLSERLTCWTLEIEESFIKTDVSHFFVFRKEEDLGRGPGEGRIKDWGCQAASRRLFGVPRAAAQDLWAVQTAMPVGHLGGRGSLLDQFPQCWRGGLLGRDRLSPCPWDDVYLGQRTFITEHPESRSSPGACPNLISLNYDKVQAVPWLAPRVQSGPEDAPGLQGPRGSDQGDGLLWW